MNKKLILLTLPFFLLTSCDSETVITYNISLDPNGGYVSETDIKISSSSFNLPTPIKDNKEFLGWYSGYSENDIKINSIKDLKEGMTIYAKWDSYDLTYLNGDESVFTIDSIKGNEVASPISDTPYILSNDGYNYNFTNWDFDYSTRINHDYTIKPIFNKEKYDSYIVKLGSFSSMKIYDYYFEFKDDMFVNKSNVFNKDLVMFGCSLSFATDSKESLLNLYDDISFDNPFFYLYDDKTQGSVHCSFAHGIVNNEEVVTITMRGMEYAAGWVNNFKVGKEGNHVGFYESSLIILKQINEYISQYNKSNLKLFVTGYSRAGALANVIGSMLNEDKELNIDNIYTYTFEAPNCFAKENLKGYKNIFNIYNSADIVAFIPPHSYDLYREGVDIDIYDINIEKYIKILDEETVIPKYDSKNKDYPTDVEFLNHFFDILTAEYQTEMSLHTREEYADTFQETLMYLFNTFTLLSMDTLLEIFDEIKNSTTSILLYLANPESLVEFLKPYLDKNQVEYSEEELLKHFTVLSTFVIKGIGVSALSTLIASKDNFTRLTRMHFPEINFVLIKKAYYSKW